MKHGKIKGRILIAAAILILTALGLIAALVFDSELPEKTDSSKKETIHLWYTDDAITDYLSRKTLDFYNQTDIRVELKLVSGLEYLETINKASLND